MSFEEAWAATEECLENEAGSLGELLERLRGRIPPILIGETQWQRMVERARDLPVSLAAFPFGFELPLHEIRPGADFGVSIVGGSRSAAHFENSGRSHGADSSSRGIAWLLQQTEPKDSPLRRIAGRKMLLEYDIEPTGLGTHPDPGIFLYPPEGMLAGDRSRDRAQDMAVVLEAVASAAGLSLQAAERQQVERVFMAMKPNTSMRALGTFPSRKRGIRLAITGFEKAQEVTEFLQRAAWSGQQSTVTSTVSRYEQRGAFGYLGIHLDVSAAGLGPMLGISFYSREGEWLRDIRPWAALIDGLREEPLIVAEKLSALANSACGAETLFGKSAPFVLVRGIHHIKLSLSHDSITGIKAYIFFLMICLKPKLEKTG